VEFFAIYTQNKGELVGSELHFRLIVFRYFLPSFSEKTMLLAIVSYSAEDDLDAVDDLDDLGNMIKT
jgi:hypothetical protein